MSEKIPFDIEKWETGEYDAVYRNGEKPLEIYFFKGVEIQPLASVSYKKELLTHSAKGLSIYSGAHELDIFLTPKKKKGWVVVFLNTNTGNLGAVTANCEIELNNIESNINKCGYKIIHESEFEY